MTPTIEYFPLRELEYDCMTVMVCILIFIACLCIWDLVSKIQNNRGPK